MYIIYKYICNSETLVQFRSRQSDKTKVALDPPHVNFFNISVESLTAARTCVIPLSLPYPESRIL